MQWAPNSLGVSKLQLPSLPFLMRPSEIGLKRVALNQIGIPLNIPSAVCKNLADSAISGVMRTFAPH